MADVLQVIDETAQVLEILQGVKGDPGTDGADGADGTDGADGADGTDGADGAGGREIFLAAIDAVAATEIVFHDADFDPAYENYVIRCERAVGNSAPLTLAFSTNDGSSFVNSNYRHTTGGHISSSTGFQNQNSSSQTIGYMFTNTTTSFPINSSGFPLSNIAIFLHELRRNTQTSFAAHAVGNRLGNINGYAVTVGGNDTAAVHNCVKIAEGAGNTLTGRFVLYGIKELTP